MNSISLFYSTSHKDYHTQVRTEEPEKIDDLKLGNSKSLVELHLNVWKVYKGFFRHRQRLYFDFGIMFSSKVKRLCLFVPFELESVQGNEKVQDLGILLHNNKDLLCAVFNSELKCHTQSNDCFCEVELSDGPRFYTYKLGSQNVEVEPFNDDKMSGTYIFLNIEGKPDNKEQTETCQTKQNTLCKSLYYVRFRVLVKDVKQVGKTVHISNDLIQSAFSESDLYDIRVNENRLVHEKVLEKATTEGFGICLFEKVHLFYMTSSKENVENASSLKCDSRLLEENSWKGYQPDPDNPAQERFFIAHHWKKRRKENSMPITSFSAFFCMTYPNYQIFRILVYICVIVLLGWLGSMLSFHFQDMSCSIRSWLKPGIIICLLVWVIIFLFKTNIGVKGLNFYRK